MNAPSLPSLHDLPLRDALRAGEICSRFDDAWNHKSPLNRPHLEDFLRGWAGRPGAALLRELLRVELAYRVRDGERPAEGDYLGRFPGYEGIVRAALAEAGLSDAPPDSGAIGAVPAPSAGGATTTPGQEAAVPEGAPAWETPVTIPGYEILGVLGGGGMGKVFKARQVSANRTVALKVIRPDRFHDLKSDEERRKWVARFRWEAEAVANLDHPNIVPLFEVGEHEEQPYFSMKFIEGDSLASAAGRVGRDPRATAGLMAAVARAVHHAHQRRILHRDLKPLNILIDPQGQPLVTDFGLARRLETAGPGGSTWDGAGTPGYMAPEQARAEHALTTAVDVYGLGAVLYDLLTGRPPHQGLSPLQALMDVVETDPPRPRELRPRVDRDLEAVCLKCLRKAPAERYGSALAVAEEMERWLRGEPVLARPAGVGERLAKWTRRRPAVAALLAVLVVTASTGFGLVTWHWRDAAAARQTAEVALASTEVEREKAVAAQQNEEAARRLAEENEARAEAALQNEAKGKREFQRLALSLSLDQGIGYCEREDIARGLLGLTHILEIATDGDRDLERVARAYLADGGRRLVSLKMLLPGRASVAAFTPGGRAVVTGRRDGTAQLWDVATGKPGREYPKHDGGISAVAFSLDGKKVAVGSTDGTTRVRETVTGEAVSPALKHGRTVTAAAFGPDDTLLVTGSRDGTARIWDTKTGDCLRTLTHKDEVLSVAFSPDGKRVLTNCKDKSARLWDTATGTLIGNPFTHDDVLHTAVFAGPDGKVVLTADGRRQRRWNAVTGQELGELPPHQQSVVAAALSPGGQAVWVANGNGTLQRRDVATGQDGPGLLGHNGTVDALVFSPNGKFVATGGRDQTARLWDADTGRLVGAPLFHQSSVRTAAFSRDGKTLLTRTEDGVVRLWKVPDPAPVRRFGGPKERVTALAFAPGGAKAMTGDFDGTVKVWDVATGGVTLSDPPRLVHKPGKTVRFARS